MQCKDVNKSRNIRVIETRDSKALSRYILKCKHNYTIPASVIGWCSHTIYIEIWIRKYLSNFPWQTEKKTFWETDEFVLSQEPWDWFSQESKRVTEKQVYGIIGELSLQGNQQRNCTQDSFNFLTVYFWWLFSSFSAFTFVRSQKYSLIFKIGSAHTLR